MSFFPSFLHSRNISVRGTRLKTKGGGFFFPARTLSKEKQVKLLKIDFQKSGKRTHFSGVRPAGTSEILL
jgi:hypothetical protein